MNIFNVVVRNAVAYKSTQAFFFICFHLVYYTCICFKTVNTKHFLITWCPVSKFVDLLICSSADITRDSAHARQGFYD